MLFESRKTAVQKLGGLCLKKIVLYPYHICVTVCVQIW